ncbi:exonuclease domain-containing protein [Faecalibacter sp. LW9]|uniref:exonuclease domain-containing protein n=1 Tax=Faecalibacter sp. LW9 TaxID=3103144 RepID=UPI002AFF7BFE|nr:exonuclease domain-containing protein [Faecalibacter sp. LW9]
MKNFVAIDFETANRKRISACSIGLSIFEDGKLIECKHFYIKPPINEEFESINMRIHKITPEDVKDACNFLDLWNTQLNSILNNQFIVLHNSSMDYSILKQLIEFYDIKNVYFKYLDTMLLAKNLGYPQKLELLCEEFNIKFDNIHKADEDSKVCGELFLKLINIDSDIENSIKHYPERDKKYYESISIERDKEYKILIDKFRVSKKELDNIVINGNNFLFTGEILEPRHIAEKFITNNGGKIVKSIQKKLNFLVVGKDYGWSKIDKTVELNNKDCSIQILLEEDFNILKSKVFQFRLTKKIVDVYDDYFIQTAKVNSFYGKYIYYSQNFKQPHNSIYQLGGNLNGTVVNHWSDESQLTNFFIISDADYASLESGELSQEVIFIQELIKKQQSIKDFQTQIISSNLKIVKFKTFENYLQNRTKLNSNNIISESELKRDIFLLTDNNN